MPNKKTESKVYHVKEVEKNERYSLWGEDLGPMGASTQEKGKSAGVGENLSPKQRADLEYLQECFPKVFSKKPGCTNLVQHVIRVKERRPVRLPPQRWPKHLKKVLIEEVQVMQELGVIEPSSSEWQSYPVMVPKPDSQTQVYLDFQKVNEVSEFNADPCPAYRS